MDKIMYLKINKSINFNLDLDVHFSSHDAAIYKGYDRNILFLIWEDQEHKDKFNL